MAERATGPLNRKLTPRAKRPRGSEAVVKLLLATVLSLLLAAPAPAAVRTVTLDDLPAETTVADQYRQSADVFWRGPVEGDYAFPVVKAPPAGIAHSGANVADVSTCAGCEFWTPASLARLQATASAVSAYVGFLGADVGNAPVEMRLIAYDASGATVDSAIATVVQGAPFDQQLTVTSESANIASFEFRGAENSAAPIGFDDLAITYPDAPAPADFSLGLGGANPANVPIGDSVDLPIEVNRVNGSAGDVTFSATGLPAGMSASFVPNPVPGSDRTATLRLTADAGAAPSPGDYTEITVTATPADPGAGPAAREVKRLVRITQNCERVYRGDYIDARSESCMQRRGNTLEVTNAEVRINGLVFRPADDSRPTLVIDPAAKTIKGKELTMPFVVAADTNPDIPLYAGPISLQFSQGNGARQVVGFKLSGVPVLKGLPITEIVASFTQNGDTILKPTLKLSFWPFNYFGSITTTTTFVVDNDNPPDFSGLELKLANVNALGIELKDVKLKWQQGGTWAGAATLVLNFARKYEVGAGFGIKEGGFDFLRGSVGGINQPIGTAVFLQRLGFGVTRNPLTLEGTIGLSGGPAVAGEKAVTVDGTVKAVLDDPFVVEVTGGIKLADRFELADAFLRYSSTGLFEFGGKAGFDLWLLGLDGRIDGWVAGATLWNVEGALEACLDVWGPNPCGNAKAILSTRGIAGCVGVYGYFVGAGARWALPPDFDAFTGCDLSPYREEKPTRRQAGTPNRLSQTTLPEGLPSAAWEIEGEGGIPPAVVLTGPGGKAVSVSRDTPDVRTDEFFAQARQDGTTFILVDKPAAGTWTVSDDGAVPVTRVREARGLPKPSVKARVRGKGRSRVLTWKAERIPGQRVAFAEVGTDVRHAIGSPTAKRRGSVRFRPADGPAGRRRIVALVEQDGLPRTNLTAGSYSAPGPLRPGKPRKLKLKRTKAGLVVRWRPRPSGFRHALAFRLTDGRRIVKVVAAGRRSYRLAGVPRSVGAKVTVLGLTRGNGKGPSASASVRRR